MKSRRDSREGLSRRALVRALGVSGASTALLSSAARPLFAATGGGRQRASAEPVLLHNNENPTGPSRAALRAMDAALGSGPPAGRYPIDAQTELPATIARALELPEDRVMIGNGSTQLLRTATHVYTSPRRPLIAGRLTYEECPAYAALVEHPVVRIPFTPDLRLDLDGMARAADGAGLIFVDNPNNPMATLHPATDMHAFVERALATDPEVVVGVDEAYHDYVTDPAYESLVSLAAERPRLVVFRTFSKAHGMAGMRLGYAVGHPETLAPMRDWQYWLSINLLALAGAGASIRDTAGLLRERRRNAEVRAWTLDWFRRHGFRATDSQTNFVFVDLGMPAREFRAGCGERGFRVGRDFAPLEDSHCRISIGTHEQMERATRAFAEVLELRATA